MNYDEGERRTSCDIVKEAKSAERESQEVRWYERTDGKTNHQSNGDNRSLFYVQPFSNTQSFCNHDHGLQPLLTIYFNPNHSHFPTITTKLFTSKQPFHLLTASDQKMLIHYSGGYTQMHSLQLLQALTYTTQLPHMPPYSLDTQGKNSVALSRLKPEESNSLSPLQHWSRQHGFKLHSEATTNITPRC